MENMGQVFIEIAASTSPLDAPKPLSVKLIKSTVGFDPSNFNCNCIFPFLYLFNLTRFTMTYTGAETGTGSRPVTQGSQRRVPTLVSTPLSAVHGIYPGRLIILQTDLFDRDGTQAPKVNGAQGRGGSNDKSPTSPAITRWLGEGQWDEPFHGQANRNGAFDQNMERSTANGRNSDWTRVPNSGPRKSN